MAITNAQQYKQLVNPPMKGKKRPGYRGDAAAAAGAPGMAGPGPGSDPGEGPASRDFGGPNRDERMGMKGRTRTTRNPMAQFGGGKPPPAYDDFTPPSTRNYNFMKDMRRAVNPFGPLTSMPGLAGMFFNAITPNPFGYSNPNLTDTGRGEGDDLPTWAQLGFSSEAEYLAALTNQRLGSTNQEPIEEDEAFQMARRFRANGGIMNDQIRQAYGIGDIVKKATRAVKKVAKSPIGKAALLYTATGGLGNLASGQSFFSNFLSPTQFLGNTGSIFSKEGLKNIAFGMPGGEYLGSPRGPNTGILTKGTKGIFGAGGVFSPLKAITAASLLPFLGLGTGDESEEEAQALLDQSGIDIDRLRNDSVYREATLARRFKAEGGSMKEPVAKKTMPLLDMGGQEMDLRAEGGFVPIGRMEKADDVPARLSKNEFVFTADAVRNAGEGDVDKGAEVMYNMMKNLEAGGDVSQESQGLEGARRMFQTSQRLEEVL